MVTLLITAAKYWPYILVTAIACCAAAATPRGDR